MDAEGWSLSVFLSVEFRKRSGVKCGRGGGNLSAECQGNTVNKMYSYHMFKICSGNVLKC